MDQTHACKSEVSPGDNNNGDSSTSTCSSLEVPPRAMVMSGLVSLTSNYDFALGNVLAYLTLQDVVKILVVLHKWDPFFAPTTRVLVTIIRR